MKWHILDSSKTLCVLVFLQISCIFVQAQSNFQHIVMPTANVTAIVSDQWRVNFKIQSRFLEGGRSEHSRFSHVHTDLAAVASRKVRLSNRLGIGALLRVRADRKLARMIQQYTIIRRYPTFRLSHRISADQTWGVNDPLEARLRYRIVAQIPLNGHSINARELYAKLGNEYVQSVAEGSYDLEIRLTPSLGYEITDKNKIELGLEHRIDSFINGKSRNRIFWTLRWYGSL